MHRLWIGFTLAAVLAAMAIAEGDRGPTTDDRRERPKTEDFRFPVRIPPLDIPQPDPACDLRVKRVVDGDTFYAETTTIVSPSVQVVEDTGFRLARVYTPERGEPGYKEAGSDLATMIRGPRPVQVVLTRPSSSGLAKPSRPTANLPRWREKYGRFFVEVFLCEKPGERPQRVNVNDRMRALGWTKSGRGVPK